jgi:hypothetical protein
MEMCCRGSVFQRCLSWQLDDTVLCRGQMAGALVGACLRYASHQNLAGFALSTPVFQPCADYRGLSPGQCPFHLSFHLTGCHLPQDPVHLLTGLCICK